MRPILAGIETEYGFTVEGRSVTDQTEDSQALVRSYPGKCFVGWDYAKESPRADLRGWIEKGLAVDPVDAAFDTRAPSASDTERADRVLTNGARFYNDHGHPEYATPECWSLDELASHDQAGEYIVLAAAKAYEARVDKQVRVYKNNTDFHGASYGTHENFLIPRSFGFDDLYEAVLPMLIARQVLTAAGKVGSETKGPVQFQISSRADFFNAAASVDTLFKRPVFNTRDEPHAGNQWVRLHVISGDANMMPSCTRRKVGLIKIALACLELGVAPTWDIPDPARSFQLVSRDPDGEGRIELKNRHWTTPRLVLESYFDALEPLLNEGELKDLISECRMLLEARFSDPDSFRRRVDWAAKYWMIDQFRKSENLRWHDPYLQSLDLSYSLLDEQEGLYSALVDSGEVEAFQASAALEAMDSMREVTRALARGSLIKVAPEAIQNLSWGEIRLTDHAPVSLSPDREYPEELKSVETLEQWIKIMQD